MKTRKFRKQTRAAVVYQGRVIGEMVLLDSHRSSATVSIQGDDLRFADAEQPTIDAALHENENR